MRKNVFGRQFKRDANERKALFKNLLTSLVMLERIKTTQEKAKAIRGAADKLVTKAKKGGPNVYQSLHPQINHNAVKKMMDDIAPRFMNRNGGYTRIIKLAKHRIADNAEMVMMEWTEKGVALTVQDAKVVEGVKEEKVTKKVAKPSAKKVAKEEVAAEVAVKTKGKTEKVKKEKTAKK